MDRRTTLKWVLAAVAAGTVGRPSDARAHAAATNGYGTDPDLSVNYRPGDPWPLTLTVAQRGLAVTLSELIIPADDQSPGASAAGVVDFIDEWVSAPYPDCQRDRGIVLGGFTWLNEETSRRFGRNFVDLEAREQTTVCDDLCAPARAGEGLRAAAQFFARYRDLTAGAFYSSPLGRKDLQFIGNVPLVSFDGPPHELLKSLGLV